MYAQPASEAEEGRFSNVAVPLIELVVLIVTLTSSPGTTVEIVEINLRFFRPILRSSCVIFPS
jgi:hypothetical protein